MKQDNIKEGFKRLENVLVASIFCFGFALDIFLQYRNYDESFTYWGLIENLGKTLGILFLICIPVAMVLNAIRYIICGFFDESAKPDDD